jgi:hypothetical protein
MCVEFYSENPKGRNHLGEQVVDGRMLLTLILTEYGVKQWNGFNWPSVESIVCSLNTVMNFLVP